MLNQSQVSPLSGTTGQSGHSPPSPTPSPCFCRSYTNTTLSHGRGSPKPGDTRPGGGDGRTGLPDGPEGGQRPYDLTEGGRKAGSQASPTSFLPAGSRTPPHTPPQSPDDTVLGGTASCHAAVPRGRGGVAGGSGGPPSLAAPRTQMAAPWQPVRRHLCLRTRCPRPPPGTGRSVRGEPARGPPAGWIQGIPGATAPPALGQLGCGGMRVGTAAVRGALAQGHPKPWEDPGVQGSSQHLNPCMGLTPGPPALGPALVMAGLGPAGIPAWGRGRAGRGIRAPHGHSPMQGQAAHPRQRQRVLPAR